jgi:hypothetical protein
VHLDVADREAIAVIGAEGGDPHEWWTAIRELTSQQTGAAVIHLDRVTLPAGLRALACRAPQSELALYVSESLDTECQRAAVMAAIRASRPDKSRRAGLPTAGVALLMALSALGALLRRAEGALAVRTLAIRALAVRTLAVRPLAVRPLAWGAAATATAVSASAAGILLYSAPHPHGSSASGRQSVPSAVLPYQPRHDRQRARTPRGEQAKPVTAGVSGGAKRVRPSPQPGRAHPSAPSPAPQPSASPSRSPSPRPSASPSPSPSGGSTSLCVYVLGVRVCLPALSLSLSG